MEPTNITYIDLPELTDPSNPLNIYGSTSFGDDWIPPKFVDEPEINPITTIHSSQCTNVETGLQTLLRVANLYLRTAEANPIGLTRLLPKTAAYTDKIRALCWED